MTKIKSFCAIRPTRDKVHLVATRPYYTYKKNIIEAKLEENPYTFMHIIHPEYGLSDQSAPNSTEKFNKVKESFEHFLHDGVLIQDESPALYVYRQTKNGKTYTGVIAGASVKEYESNKIKKHEATLTSREEVFVNYLDITGFNAEPVLLAHRPHTQLTQTLSEICLTRSEYEFSTTDTVKHEIWIVAGKLEERIKACFEEIEELYIADGHHRSASSALLAKKYASKSLSEDPINFFLSYLIDETELDILPFHRIAKSRNKLDEKQFLEKLSENFNISPAHKNTPISRHEILLLLDKKYYLLSLKNKSKLKQNPVAQLDPQLLTDFILNPILGISDLKTDTRIEFISGEEGLELLIEKVNQYPEGIGFVLSPVCMEEVKAVADAELTMPPKSTWVEPKLRSGLIIYPLFTHD